MKKKELIDETTLIEELIAQPTDIITPYHRQVIYAVLCHYFPNESDSNVLKNRQRLLGNGTVPYTTKLDLNQGNVTNNKQRITNANLMGASLSNVDFSNFKDGDVSLFGDNLILIDAKLDRAKLQGANLKFASVLNPPILTLFVSLPPHCRPHQSCGRI